MTVWIKKDELSVVELTSLCCLTDFEKFVYKDGCLIYFLYVLEQLCSRYHIITLCSCIGWWKLVNMSGNYLKDQKFKTWICRCHYLMSPTNVMHHLYDYSNRFAGIVRNLIDHLIFDFITKLNLKLLNSLFTCNCLKTAFWGFQVEENWLM